MSRLMLASWVLVGSAIVLAVAPVPPALVERWYSTGLYAGVQPVLTRASNAVPFVVMDAAAGVVLAAFAWLVVADVRRRGWKRAGVRGTARLVVWSAAIYLAFLAGWGLNYRRVPLEE